MKECFQPLALTLMETTGNKTGLDVINLEMDTAHPGDTAALMTPPLLTSVHWTMAALEMGANHPTSSPL